MSCPHLSELYVGLTAAVDKPYSPSTKRGQLTIDNCKPTFAYLSTNYTLSDYQKGFKLHVGEFAMYANYNISN
jgi:hypothetical protein